MKKHTFLGHPSLLAILAIFALSPLPSSAATVNIDTISSGDLIRGSTHNAVYYYGEDGFRYVFPNSKTYFTWYDNFDTIKWLSDADLSTIQIGGNVTYKPGEKMLKIQSDPKVYTVAGGGILRAIGSEQVASELYGQNWNQQVDDVPDGFFSNYTLGTRLEFASQYSPQAEMQDALNINDDKNLKPALVVHITDNGYDPATTSISSNTAVRFVNETSDKHSATEWDRVWGSGTLGAGDHFSRYFTQKGTWSYYDTYLGKIHSNGSLTVK